MKLRWFMMAGLAGAALLSASGLPMAQTVSSSGIIASRSVWSGVYTAAQANRGAVTYYQVCAQCHGRELEGDDSEGITPLAGPHFMINWDTHSVADLVRRIHAQPNDEAGDIDVVTATDLVAFILAYNRIPAGTVELPTDRPTVQTIGISAQPPDGIELAPQPVYH